MTSLLSDLVPFGLGAAIVPGVVTVTLLLLLRNQAGPTAAAAWVAGMVSVRLAQGAAFGGIIPTQPAVEDTGRTTVVATVMLVLSILMFITAARMALGGEDEETSTQPPKWMSMIRSVTPARAFLYGALLIVLSAKQWVFTLGAIGAIGEAATGPVAAIVVYVAFVAAVVSPSVAIVVVAFLAPDRSAPKLDAVLNWLRGHNDTIVISLGLVFGFLFGIKALQDFGIL